MMVNTGDMYIYIYQLFDHRIDHDNDFLVKTYDYIMVVHYDDNDD